MLRLCTIGLLLLFGPLSAATACKKEWSRHECDMFQKWRRCFATGSTEETCRRLLKDHECDDPRMSDAECTQWIHNPGEYN